MKYKVYPPTQTQLETHKQATCVVELTTEELLRGVLLYAAERDEYLPHGRAELKKGKTHGMFLMTIRFDADET